MSFSSEGNDVASDNEEEMEKQMGDVDGPDENRLDEQMWGSDEEEEDSGKVGPGNKSQRSISGVLQLLACMSKSDSQVPFTEHLGYRCCWKFLD